MSEINTNFCRVCLQSNALINLSRLTTFDTVLNKIFGTLVDAKEIRLCVWCKSVLSRLIHFIKTLEESQHFLENYPEICIKTQTSKSEYRPYNLSFHHNTHEDIPPIKIEENSFFYDETIQEDLIDINESIDKEKQPVFDPLNVKKSNIEQSNYQLETKTEIIEQESDKNKNKNKRNNLNYQEMKFELKYLNQEEQLKEIEIKKQTVKYKSMKYHCEKCGIGFLTSDVFDEHMKRHKQVSTFKCPTCHLYFKSKEVLSQHLLAHRRRFVCLVCDSSFNRWRHCIHHRLKCDGIQNSVVCDLCKKVYSDAISLDIHIKGVHKKDRKYICDQCNRGFVTKQRLTMHLRSHSKTRLFSCSLCARAFTSNSNLRAHLSVHTQCKNYYCVECDAFFKTEKGLKRHLKEAKRHLS